VRIGHVRLDTGASIQVHGKRRKQRVTPLTPGTVKVLRVWLRERRGNEDDPLFPTRQGRPLSPKAIAWLLDKHTSSAAIRCPSLNNKRVTPHVLRHYVDGWVMWPAGAFPLLTASGAPVPAT
jgi:integrase/recombinase XerD